MAKKHGRTRQKEKKETPAQKRKTLLEAIICMLCDKTDCVNRFKCKAYKSSEEQFSEDFKELDQKLGEEEEMKE